MTFNEIIRLLVVVSGGCALGLMAALFTRVGVHFVPHKAMRATMAGASAVVMGVVMGSLGRLWFAALVTPSRLLVLLGLIAWLAGLVAVFHWYGTPAGRRHAAVMRASVEQNEDDPLAVPPSNRLLTCVSVAIVVYFVIGVFVLIGVGQFALHTHRQERRTHAALCRFTDELRQRALGTQLILDDPANAGAVIHAYGLTIPRNVLQNQVDGQHKTLASLSGLGC